MIDPEMLRFADMEVFQLRGRGLWMQTLAPDDDGCLFRRFGSRQPQALIVRAMHGKRSAPDPPIHIAFKPAYQQRERDGHGQIEEGNDIIGFEEQKA